MIKTIGSILGSVGKAVNMGMDLGTGRGLKGGGYGAMIGIGAIGGAISGATASFSSGTVDPLSSTGLGAVSGAIALPAAGLAMGAIGSGAMKGATMLPGIAGGIGQGIISASPYVAGIATYGASKIASTTWGVGSRLINWKEDADAFNKVKISGLGKTLLAGTSLFEGARGSLEKIQQSRMGTNMGVVRMAPRVPSYLDNANATGDLVFALNANRRG